MLLKSWRRFASARVHRLAFEWLKFIQLLFQLQKPGIVFMLIIALIQPMFDHAQYPGCDKECYYVLNALTVYYPLHRLGKLF